MKRGGCPLGRHRTLLVPTSHKFRTDQNGFEGPEDTEIEILLVVEFTDTLLIYSDSYTHLFTYEIFSLKGGGKFVCLSRRILVTKYFSIREPDPL